MKLFRIQTVKIFQSKICNLGLLVSETRKRNKKNLGKLENNHFSHTQQRSDVTGLTASPKIWREKYMPRDIADIDLYGAKVARHHKLLERVKWSFQ